MLRRGLLIDLSGLKSVRVDPASGTVRVEPGVTLGELDVMNVHTRWQTPAEDEECIRWAREFFDRTAPHATSGVNVNFMSQDEGGRVGDA